MASPTAGIRDRNEREILRVLLAAGDAGITRPDLAVEVGLSPAAVSNLVSGRISGVINSDPVASGRTGPKPRALSIDPTAGRAVAMDFGQTYLGAGLFDLFGKELRPRQYIDFDAGEDAAGALAWMTDRARDLVPVPSGLVGVGISIAAPVAGNPAGPRDDGFAMPDWKGKKPGEELRQALGWECPFEVGNDADLAGIAEQHWGAARGHSDFVFVKWTWGIGAAIVSDGRLRRGNGLAGELGHLRVTLDDRHTMARPAFCPACRRHCLQTVAAMPALLADAGVPDATSRSHLKDNVVSLVARLEAGDERASRALTRACGYLGQALGSVVTLLNPGAVIVGGDLRAEHYELYASDLLEGIRANTTSAAIDDVSLYAGATTGRASLLGAAGSILDEHLLDYLMGQAADS